MKPIITCLAFLAGIAAFVGIQGCGSTASYIVALRIRPEKKDRSTTLPATGADRDAVTLRGTVIEARKARRIDDPGVIETFYLFRDLAAPDGPDGIERIPVSDVVVAWPGRPQHDDDCGGCTLVETYNNVVEPAGLRLVPWGVDTAVYTKECRPCAALGAGLRLDCVPRELSRFFLELRGVYASYSDIRGYVDPERRAGAFHEQRQTLPAFEVAGGIRFGAQRQWGAGLALSFNEAARNPATGGDITRWLLLAHLRLSAVEPWFLCFRPFAYLQVGGSLDADTYCLWMSALNIDNESHTTANRAVSEGANVGYGIPLTFGFGAGVDLAVSKTMDISIDAGYRSWAVGEPVFITTDQNRYANLPALRRIDQFRLRFGVTF